MRHVYLYPTQPLIPQCLALGLYLIERSIADFRFRVCTSLLLREERNSDPDDHLRWAPRKREERAGFHHVAIKATRESKLRFAKSSCDQAVPVLPKLQLPTRSNEEIYKRVRGPDAKLIQFLCAVVEVITSERLVFERPRPKTARHVVISFQRINKAGKFGNILPRAPEATDRDSPRLRVDGHISAFE
jgi:hypothetical protein